MKTKVYNKPTTTVFNLQTEPLLVISRSDAPAKYEEGADEDLTVLSRFSIWNDDEE